MKLYHSTPSKNVPSIIERGLVPNKMGIIYLAPTFESVYKGKGRTILKVETGNNRLSAFDDCKDWEIFCWGNIPPENIEVIKVIE